ncbi:MAG: hypothetical protein JO069_13885 [Verrucomicrobia bacterium]|nr:hypothetical protein [Verrucomicrobiota bacterium]
MAQLTKRLLLELKAWCENERGRKSQVAKFLGIRPQALSNLFAGRQQLTGEQTLMIQEFLRSIPRAERA